MSVRRRAIRSVVVLYPSGSFFGDEETDALQKAILDEAASGNLRLVLNLSDCQALNSMAIGVLMRGFANYKSRGGEVKICGLGKRVRDIFTMTKLIMVFEHHETEEQALAAFAD